MDKDFHKTFPLCPNCGSTDRFCEQLGQELKDRGLARQEWGQHYDVRQGVVVDQNRKVMLPIGISLPGYIIHSDICMDCGTIYAIEIRRIEGSVQAVQRPTAGSPPPGLFLGHGN